jgi:hypothetical protein
MRSQLARTCERTLKAFEIGRLQFECDAHGRRQ